MQCEVLHLQLCKGQSRSTVIKDRKNIMKKVNMCVMSVYFSIKLDHNSNLSAVSTQTLPPS